MISNSDFFFFFFETYVTRTSKAKTLLQQPPKISDKIMGRSEANICTSASVKLLGLSISTKRIDSYQTKKGKIAKKIRVLTFKNDLRARLEFVPL